MNKLFAVLLLAFFVGAAFGADRHLQAKFTKWMRDNNKIYPSDEFQSRFATWKANYEWVEEFNKRADVSFTVAVNGFADLANEEFNTLFKGLKRIEVTIPDDVPEVDTSALPSSVDWRTKGVVTGIKNQGQCGSCWSFSTTGSTEGAHAINTGTLVSLSEQNLVDCSTAQGNQGCDGGLMTDAFNYIISNGGIDTEGSYPYTAEDGTCHYSAANCGSTLATYSNVQSGSESSLQSSVVVGPTSVAIDASHNSFQMYSSGVYYEPNCSPTQLDHGVLAVGYGSSSGSDYWIVKNSWGTSWGMSGYIWMSRNRNNNCGIATMASLPASAGANKC